MKLNNRVMESMAVGKAFKDNTAKINSLDFSKEGDFLITASDDESLHIYNTISGKKHKSIFSKKYGVDLIRFTHHSSSVICASKNSWDESLRYLSLHDNRYLRYFKGHRDKVVSLALSPTSDFFISGSLDNTIRLWDLNSNNCQGLLRRKGRPSVSFDPQGLIFAVATSTNIVKLYDLRSYDKGPFSSFLVNHQPVEWTTMKFSGDGKYILLSTTTNAIFLLDSFTGDTKQVYTSFVNSSGLTLESCFTPDGQYVISGSEDGSVHVWETLTGKETAVWKGQGHTGPVNAVQWSPTSVLFASADTSLSLWTPSITDE